MQLEDIPEVLVSFSGLLPKLQSINFAEVEEGNCSGRLEPRPDKPPSSHLVFSAGFFMSSCPRSGIVPEVQLS